MDIRIRRWTLAVVFALLVSAAVSGGAHASRDAAGQTDDRLLTPRVTPAGTYDGVRYVQYDGVFEGATSTGAFRVPYRITAPAVPGRGNGTVVVEPPHFVVGLGALQRYLRPDLLLGHGFAHAGIGWSTTAYPDGGDKRILDPTTPGVFIQGGFADDGGRTDYEIVADFAAALAADRTARSLLGSVAARYLTGFSDSSVPVMDLVTSGRADKVFDLALPFTTEWADPQPALDAGMFRGKLVILNSEADESDSLVDRGVVPNRYRFYRVAGTPHIPDQLDIPFFSSRTTPASFSPALRAHFLQGHRWVRSGTGPPASYHLKTTPVGDVDRDANGNAIAVNTRGQRVPRLPFIELGEARYVTGFLGSYDEVRTATALGFRSHAAYHKAFRAELADYAAAGYILREDAAAMRARAALCPPLTYTETYRDHYDNFVAIQPCAG